MGIFKQEGPLMVFLGKVADLVILNALTLLFCIPIVTIGASLTACHYTALKMCRSEGYIARNFWKSFKENFRQSTVIFLILTVFGVFSVLAIWILSANPMGVLGTIVQSFLTMCLILTVIIGVWVYPVQSKFINTVGQTLMKAFIFACRYFFRTIVMVLIAILPIVLLLVFPPQWYSLLLLFGFSFPIYLSAKMYNKVFERIEEAMQG